MSSNDRLDGYAFQPAWRVAEAIQRGEVTSRELTLHTLRRIDEINPRINSVVSVMQDQALKRAGEADEAHGRGETWGPLHGVPCTVKDQFEVAGMVTTCGLPEYAADVPDTDAVVVKRLKAAGAVIIGHTNVPAGVADWQSYNEVYGTTVNPWDPGRTPGGSSGGCAASLAAGLTYLSVGSDFAGSIRVPAHFCGVYGHRPSLGVVPGGGTVPNATGDALRPPPNMSTPGPLARSPRDLELALRVIGGPGGDEAKAYGWTLPPPRGERLTDYRIGFVIDEPLCPLSSGVRDVIVDALSKLRGAGAPLDEGWPRGVDPTDQYGVYQYLRFANKAKALKDEDVEETRRRASRKGEKDWIEAWAWTAPHKEFMAMEEARFRVRETWQRFFQSHDAFIMPVDFVAAFPHDHMGLMAERTLETPEGPRRYIDQLFWMSFSSLTGLPCTVAPVGFTVEGLPVGVQILGPYLEDATPIHVAELMAGVVGGYVKPVD
ncbi:amidase [Candidatus Bathyarchaeota archaeon]|nr:amidase [Candidatus Bathyarchaeota archaeon]